MDIFSLGITFVVVLMKTESLSRITAILESLHEAKTEGALGKKLFDAVEDHVREDAKDLSQLKDLIFAMLAGAANRYVGLAAVAG